MKSDPTVSRLRTLPAFRGHRDRDLRSLTSLVDRAEIPPGHILTHQGDFARQAFLVLRGSAEVSIDGHGAQRRQRAPKVANLRARAARSPGIGIPATDASSNSMA